MKKQSFIFASLIITTILVGCGAVSPESQAAHLIKQKMHNPDSFVTIDTTTMWKGKDSKSRDAYVVKVAYKAQNLMGGTVQDCRMVAFVMDENNIRYNESRAFDKCGREGRPLFSPKKIAQLMSSQFTM